MMEVPSKRMDVDIDFIPFSVDMMDTLKVKDYDIPDEKAYVENFVSLEDRENFFQRLRGTLGRNLNFEN